MRDEKKCETCRWWQASLSIAPFPGREKFGLCMNPLNDMANWNVVHGGAIRMISRTEGFATCGEHQPKDFPHD